MIDLSERVLIWATRARIDYSSRYADDLIHALRGFIEWLTEHQIEFQSVGADEVRIYLAERTLDGTTALAAIRKFFESLEADGIVSSNPTTSVVVKGRTRLRVAGPSEHDVKVWLDGLQDQLCLPSKDPRPYLARARVWAIAELIYSSGLTTGEIAQLRLADFDGVNLALRVGTRIVPVTAQAANAISMWRLLIGSRISQRSLYLFHAADSPQLALKSTAIWNELKSASLQMRSGYTPDGLRQAFVRHVTARGLDPDQVNYILGVKSTSFVTGAT